MLDEAGIYRYEIGTIINNNRNIINITNDIEEATVDYEKAINLYDKKNTKDHVIVFLYDYDRNTNINYYDNEIDIC